MKAKSSFCLGIIAALTSAGTCPCLAGPSPNASPNDVVTLEDPFYPGSVLQITHLEKDTAAHTDRSEGIDYTYGFSNGVALGLFVPVYLTNSPPYATGATVPRIGGQGYSEIEFDGFFRFWGNAARYLGLELGVVPPFQSDPALRNSLLDRIVLPVTLLAQYGNSFISLKLNLTDEWQFPPISVSSKGLSSYRDWNDTFNISTTLQFWPESRLAPYLSWVEIPVYAYTAGQDEDASALITSAGHTSESRVFGLGLTAVPWAKFPLAVNLEVDSQVLPENQAAWAWQAKFRCAL